MLESPSSYCHDVVNSLIWSPPQERTVGSGCVGEQRLPGLGSAVSGQRLRKFLGDLYLCCICHHQFFDPTEINCTYLNLSYLTYIVYKYIVFPFSIHLLMGIYAVSIFRLLWVSFNEHRNDYMSWRSLSNSHMYPRSRISRLCV